MSIGLDEKCITIYAEYGNTVDGKWTRGILAPAIFSVKNTPPYTKVEVGEPPTVTEVPEDPQYDIMVSTLPKNTTTPLYYLVAQTLYAWVLVNSSVKGTIV
jgi:hypothetical protein